MFHCFSGKLSLSLTGVAAVAALIDATEAALIELRLLLCGRDFFVDDVRIVLDRMTAD